MEGIAKEIVFAVQSCRIWNGYVRSAYVGALYKFLIEQPSDTQQVCT